MLPFAYFISIVLTLITPPQDSQSPRQWKMPTVPGDTTIDRRMPIDPTSDFTTVDKQPVPVRKVQPEIPEDQRMIKATVWIKALVDTTGHVKDAVVIKSDRAMFNEPSMHAAKQWTFTPAESLGKKVAIWVALPFRFGDRK